MAVMLEIAPADAFECESTSPASPAERSARRLVCTLRSHWGHSLRLLTARGERLQLQEGGERIEILWARVEADAPARDSAERWLALLERPLEYARHATPPSTARRWLLVEDASAAAGSEKVAAGLALARSRAMSACLERCERVFVHDERDLWSFDADSFGFRTLRAPRFDA